MPDGVIGNFGKTIGQDQEQQKTTANDVRGLATEIWSAADDIDNATHGALSAFALVFSVLEDTDRVAQNLDGADGESLRGYVERLYYLIGDLHSRMKTVRDRGATVAVLAGQSERSASGETRAATADAPAARRCFDPRRLIGELVDAVRPLVTDTGDLAEGKTDLDVLLALKPVIGDLTLEEGIYLYTILAVAERSFEKKDQDDPRWNALLRTRWSLQDFVGNAYSTSAGCMAARAWLGEFARWDVKTFGGSDDLSRHIAHMAPWDIRDLRTGDFSGDRFFDVGASATTGPRWFTIMNIDRNDR